MDGLALQDIIFCPNIMNHIENLLTRLEDHILERLDIYPRAVDNWAKLVRMARIFSEWEVIHEGD